MSNGPPDSAVAHAAEIAAGDRFAFGANWARFLRHLDAERIGDAERSLRQMLDVSTLAGSRFLDAGSGSGLFSLAARRMGAEVHSFDFDPESVACTRFLRDRHAVEVGALQTDKEWRIEEGSVLDRAYVERLGEFDVVYSWGVLHHTGDQWAAIDNVSRAVRSRGRLFIAIYNDQGIFSRIWTVIKRLYNRHPLCRWPLILIFAPYLVGLRCVYRQLSGRGRVGRGMTLWYDMIDWLGGYPFETARPEQILRFLRSRGFELREMVTEGGRAGCNEFVFERVAATTSGPPTDRTAA